MFGSSILDIGVGLIVVYLTVSLLCTAVNEMIASACGSRARELVRGIRNLLDGQSKFANGGFKALATRISGHDPRMEGAGEWATDFFAHPLIDGLSKQKELPSYIPSSTFATVLLQLVGSKTNPPAGPAWLTGARSISDVRPFIEALPNKDASKRIKETLLALIAQAESNPTTGVPTAKQFSDQIETWFNQAMDRVSGWYKRRTQLTLLIIAIFATAIMNVDTIAICRALGKSQTMRESVVAVAQKINHDQTEKKNPTTAPSVSDAFDDVKKGVDRLDQLGLPIGWDSRDLARDGWLMKLVGLLATAIAASLGAPFWFDILSKLVNIRSTGKVPDKGGTAKADSSSSSPTVTVKLPS